MFEFLYILIMFVGIYFLGSITYPILELIRMCLVLLRKQAIFRPWFNFFMSFILVLFMALYMLVCMYILRYGYRKDISGFGNILGIVLVIIYFSANIMCVLKTYCNIKKIEYNKKTVLKHFVFSLMCIVLGCLSVYPIVCFWWAEWW